MIVPETMPVELDTVLDDILAVRDAYSRGLTDEGTRSTVSLALCCFLTVHVFQLNQMRRMVMWTPLTWLVVMPL